MLEIVLRGSARMVRGVPRRSVADGSRQWASGGNVLLMEYDKKEVNTF
jgi:hypothetical protein